MLILTDLPDELLFKIATYLPPQYLLAFALICKTTKNASIDNEEVMKYQAEKLDIFEPYTSCASWKKTVSDHMLLRLKDDYQKFSYTPGPDPRKWKEDFWQHLKKTRPPQSDISTKRIKVNILGKFTFRVMEVLCESPYIGIYNYQEFKFILQNAQKFSASQTGNADVVLLVPESDEELETLTQTIEKILAEQPKNSTVIVCRFPSVYLTLSNSRSLKYPMLIPTDFLQFFNSIAEFHVYNMQSSIATATTPGRP